MAAEIPDAALSTIPDYPGEARREYVSSEALTLK